MIPSMGPLILALALSCVECHSDAHRPPGRAGGGVNRRAPPAEPALWRGRPGDRRGCVDCHAGGATAHFAGVRDPAFLAGAVSVSLTARAVRLENRTGHAFPTDS